LIAHQSLNKKPDDHCPQWADRLILRLKLLELSLGNICRGGSIEKGWQDHELSELVKSLERDKEQERGHSFSESQVDYLFQKLSQALYQQGFSPEDIAKFINKRLTGSAKLPYCSAQEVTEAL
jgi:hypothetical protein